MNKETKAIVLAGDYGIFATLRQLLNRFVIIMPM